MITIISNLKCLISPPCETIRSSIDIEINSFPCGYSDCDPSCTLSCRLVPMTSTLSRRSSVTQSGARTRGQYATHIRLLNLPLLPLPPSTSLYLFLCFALSLFQYSFLPSGTDSSSMWAQYLINRRRSTGTAEPFLLPQ